MFSICIELPPRTRQLSRSDPRELASLVNSFLSSSASLSFRRPPRACLAGESVFWLVRTSSNARSPLPTSIAAQSGDGSREGRCGSYPLPPKLWLTPGELAWGQYPLDSKLWLTLGELAWGRPHLKSINLFMNFTVKKFSPRTNCRMRWMAIVGCFNV